MDGSNWDVSNAMAVGSETNICNLGAPCIQEKAVHQRHDVDSRCHPLHVGRIRFAVVRYEAFQGRMNLRSHSHE